MMTAIRNSVEISRVAAQEILAQAMYYEQRTLGDRLSLRWERSVAKTIESLLRAPQRGALCGFKAPRLTGMRRISVIGFPNHAIYYFVSDGVPEIKIARVVHGARDLAAVLE